ncbi:MAG: nuclear transport factor 2 family protein [Firmicutes bacterium]|nr:nuclear transport factor 2 family protein [Bacillota bacterium]
MNVQEFAQAVLRQDAVALRSYFAPDAYVNWHCSNEHFTAEEYIIANCEYPGDWEGELERVEEQGDLLITAMRVWSKGGGASFHVTSFIRLAADKIIAMDEYWADDAPAPAWRQDKRIGRPIR